MKKVIERLSRLVVQVREWFRMKFWQVPYRLRIWREGGQTSFVMKRVSPRKMREAVVNNVKTHVRCCHSVHNGKWCKLPCLWCEKFEEVADGKREGDASGREA